MFYEVFFDLCKSKKESPSSVAVKCGFSKSAVTRWKNDGTAPARNNLKKISDYFGVSIDYLLDNEQKEKAEPVIKDKFSQMFYALDEDDRQEIVDIMKMKLDKSKYKKENAG